MDGMITQAITIAIILGGCAAAVLFAKSNFQPEIERSLARIESEEGIVARRKPSRD